MKFALTNILIHMIVPAVLLCLSGKIDPADTHTLRYPKAMAGIIIGGSILGIGLLIAVWFQEPPTLLFIIIVYIPVCLFLAFAQIGSLLTVNWKLVLADEYLIYRNLFRVTRQIRYEDILKIVPLYRDKAKNIGGYKIYTTKCKIKLEYVMVNFDCFQQNIKRKLKKAKNPIQF